MPRMADRFEDALANLESGCASQDDFLVMREALVGHIARGARSESRNDIAAPTAFRQLCSGWLIGKETYPDWIGFGHIHTFLSHPGSRFHVQELTNNPDSENARKATQQAIKRAIVALADLQPTIGWHLDSHITTGEFCCYSGDWRWLL